MLDLAFSNLGGPRELDSEVCRIFHVVDHVTRLGFVEVIDDSKSHDQQSRTLGHF